MDLPFLHLPPDHRPPGRCQATPTVPCRVTLSEAEACGDFLQSTSSPPGFTTDAPSSFTVDFKFHLPCRNFPYPMSSDKVLAQGFCDTWKWGPQKGARPSTCRAWCTEFRDLSIIPIFVYFHGDRLLRKLWDCPVDAASGQLYPQWAILCSPQSLG